MSNTNDVDIPTVMHMFETEVERQLSHLSSGKTKAILRMAGYGFAMFYAASQITKKEDLVTFASLMDGKIRGEIIAQERSLEGVMIRELAEKVLGDWLQERRQEEQLAELDGKLKSLLTAVVKIEAKREAKGSRSGSNVEKRDRAIELLSGMEELGAMARELKAVVNKSEKLKRGEGLLSEIEKSGVTAKKVKGVIINGPGNAQKRRREEEPLPKIEE